MVTGRRLVWVTASTLPRMGITDWEHIQVCHAVINIMHGIFWNHFEATPLCMQLIAGKVRELLGLEPPYWNHSITLPHASDLAIFLEQKSFTGRKSDQLQYVPDQ